MTQTLRETSSIDVGCYLAYAGAIGSCPAWQGVLAAAVRVATTEATVFLQGDSGTGKEVIARLIHQASPRNLGPFMVATSGDVRDQPKVAHGASDLLQDVFGRDKNPSRLVYGVASLPLGTPVELEVIFEVSAR